MQLTKISNLNYTVVTKFINLPSKLGIGYALSNGDIGLLFNDWTKLILKIIFDKVFYFNENDNLEYSNHTYKNIKPDLSQSKNFKINKS